MCCSIGNPTSYLGYTLNWNGRQLSSLSGEGTENTYTYDSDGLRVSKTINGVKTYYQYSGDIFKIVKITERYLLDDERLP